MEVKNTKHLIGLRGFGYEDNTRFDPAEFNEQRLQKLRELIREHLEKAPGIRRTNDAYSYRLKHLFERAIGEYVPNGEAILAMILEGFTPEREALSPNCWFNIDVPKGGVLSEYRRR